MGDPGRDRPLATNFTRLVANKSQDITHYSSLTHHLNRLYALLHGYRFRRPELDDLDVHWMLWDGMRPQRRVQWSIVRLIQRELEDPACDYVVWMDSDAFIVSSEPLETILLQHGLANASRPQAEKRIGSKHFFFAAAAS